MTQNRYGKKSKLQLQIKQGKSRSELERASFTAPFKITSPFYTENGNMRIMIMSVSAAIMAGDRQLVDIDVKEQARVEILSQSFEKIHRMPPGDLAVRETKIRVSSGGLLIYSPLPFILFAEAAFKNDIEIHMQDDTARLFFGEILACGRVSREKKFAFQLYRSLLKISGAEGLIYLDNSYYCPGENDLQSYCMFEGFTHLLNLIMVNIKPDEEQNDVLKALIAEFSDGIAGMSRTGTGDICIRALANGSEPLMELHESLKVILN